MAMQMTLPAPLQDKRVWLAGGAIVAVVLVAASWFLLINPKLSSASALREQTSAAQLQNSILTGKTAELKQQSQHLDTLKTDLRTALAGLPADSGLPAFTDELTAAAGAAKVKLTSITVGSVTPIGNTGSTAAAGTASSLFSIPVTIISTGTLVRDLGFVKGIEDGSRRVLVNSMQLSVASGSRTSSLDSAVSITTQLTLFSQPQTAEQSAALQKLLDASPSS